MRSPPLVPDFDVTVHVVLDDAGDAGHVYREADEEIADRETVVRELLANRYRDPIRVVAFNTAEGWSRDVSEEIAREVRSRADARGQMLERGTAAFITRHIGEPVSDGSI
jgi:hypothetical protein